MTDVQTIVAAETGVIGSVLLDERIMAGIADTLRPEDFYDRRLGGLWRGMLDMRGQEPIGVVTVAGRLSGWDVRGVTVENLHRFVEGVVSPAHGPALAAQVRDAAMMRAAGVVADRLREAQDSRDPGATIAAAINDLQAIEDSRLREDFGTVTISDLLASPTEYDWLIPGLLERQDRFMLTGDEGGGKSWFMQQLALCTAAGVHPFEPWTSIPSKRVLVIDAENTGRQWARRAKLLAPAFADRDALDRNLGLATIRRMNLTSPADLGGVHRLIDRHKPDLVMIGPLYRLVPFSITTDDEASPVLAALDTIRDRGIALAIEAHAGKSVSSSGERNLAPRGSSALLGWPEFGYGLRRKTKAEATLPLWRGSREERGWPKALTWNLHPGHLPWVVKNG